MPSPPRLDEKAVRQVLARAVELEFLHGSELTESQVREIAADLRIPEAAIGRALSEHWEATASRAATSPSRRWRSQLVLVALLGIALVGLSLAAVRVTVHVPHP
jgi:hypothetical protein